MHKFYVFILFVAVSLSVHAQSYGILVNDTMYYAATLNTSAQDPSFTEYQVLKLPLHAGDKFALCDKDNRAVWAVLLDSYSTSNVALQSDVYTCFQEGCYDFYIKLKYQQDQLYVGQASDCSHPATYEVLHLGGDGPQPSGSAVPSECEDVLLQAFYFDSYEVDSVHPGTVELGATGWKDLLKQSGEIGAYFDLVWLPPSAYASGTGYHPRQYSNQSSDWGSRANLEKLIASFHNSGTKVVADMVVNHIEAMASWCDFATMNFGEYGSFTPDGSYICANDEMNNPVNRADTLAGECWGTATGANDDGANWDGARDWAHDSENVRQMMRAYAQWMVNVMHYDGFRYDKGDGFHQSHMNDYNNAAKPYIAFMELWSGNDEIIRGIENANRNVMALDFQTKYSAFDGIAGWNYASCKGSGLLGRGYAKYAITFVDSHDWFLRGNGQEFGGNGNSLSPALKYRLLGANAFMLSMPGVPCVFYPHWVTYKEEIKAMINARHMAGVHSESTVSDEYASATGYQVTVHGHKGDLVLCLGDRSGQNIVGFTRVAYGASTQQGHNEGYAIWVRANRATAPGLIVTPDASFSDLTIGMDVSVKAVGGSSSTRTVYYTLDGTDPTLSSASFVNEGTIHIDSTTVVKLMAACDDAVSPVQTYTYTYREPLARGIRLRFKKPQEWDKAYVYAWIPGVDSLGNATSTNMLGAFPGQRLYQAQDGWYTMEFDASLDSINFRINSGVDCGGLNVSSNDLVADYDVCYGWAEGASDQSQMELLLDCEEELHPDFALSISPESGVFRSQSVGQQVTLTAIGSENAMIYYTLDGSTPTTASQSAQGSVTFTVTQTTTVKAFAYKSKTEQTSIETATYTYKAPQSGPMTVRFLKPDDWSDVYLYAFTRVKVGAKYKDTPYPLNGSAANAKWPGMKWTNVDGEGWNTFTFPTDMKEIYVIFNVGSNKTQTQDIYLDEDACYLWNPTCYKAVRDDDCDGSVPEAVEHMFVTDRAVEKLVVEGHLYIRVGDMVFDSLGVRVK